MLIVTTDKVYANAELRPRLRAKAIPLGGDEPYGASKAAAELVVAAYRQTSPMPGRRIGSQRARRQCHRRRRLGGTTG